VRIRPVDVGSDDELARFHAVDTAAHRVGRPYATVWTLPEFTVTVRSMSHTVRQLLVVAEEEDAHVVGAGLLELPLSDNTHLAELRVSVHPDHRRRGVGTALAASLRAEAEAAGRRLASAWIPGRQLWPGAPADEPGADRFAQRCGLTLRNTDVHRVLELPVDPAFLDRLAAAAAPHHRDYEISVFTGPCPDEYVDAYCRLKAAMVTEAPMGDVEMEPGKWDESRLREEEADLAGMRRTRFSAFAVAADGRVAGFNELLHAAHDIGNAYNWDTLVLPAHRGHRLGMGLKVANLRRFQPAFPDARRVHTHNAAQNAPMIAVNDAVGFVPVEQVGEWQGPVSDLPLAPA
jgi:GNAT superfamily N-acetyltransferase